MTKNFASQNNLAVLLSDGRTKTRIYITPCAMHDLKLKFFLVAKSGLKGMWLLFSLTFNHSITELQLRLQGQKSYKNTPYENN